MQTPEATVELDLTIHADSLPAPSGRIAEVDLGYNDSPLNLRDPAMCRPSVTTICTLIQSC
jgi:hypothetical protein